MDVGSVEIAGANLYLSHERMHASHALSIFPMFVRSLMQEHISDLDPRSGHMGAKKQCFEYAVFSCFVARSDAVAELGSPLSGGAT